MSRRKIFQHRARVLRVVRVVLDSAEADLVVLAVLVEDAVLVARRHRVVLVVPLIRVVVITARAVVVLAASIRASATSAWPKPRAG